MTTVIRVLCIQWQYSVWVKHWYQYIYCTITGYLNRSVEHVFKKKFTVWECWELPMKQSLHFTRAEMLIKQRYKIYLSLFPWVCVCCVHYRMARPNFWFTTLEKHQIVRWKRETERQRGIEKSLISKYCWVRERERREGGSSLTRSHPVMNVWECLWNIDECVMKQSRQTPSEHWAKEGTETDRERRWACMCFCVDDIWPLLRWGSWGKCKAKSTWTLSPLMRRYNSPPSSHFSLEDVGPWRCWTLKMLLQGFAPKQTQ